MHGHYGPNRPPHARLSLSFLGMDAWMTLQLNVALIVKVREYVGHWCAWLTFSHVFHWRLYNQALADVRSSSAGIKCLYCQCRPLSCQGRPPFFTRDLVHAIYNSTEHLLCNMTKRQFVDTVLTFNSCTKCLGIPGAQYTPSCQPVSWAWMQPHVLDLTTERSFM